MAKSFLGTGWNFPVAFDKADHQVELSSGLEDIRQSIFVILGTTPGERVMQPEFGCNLTQLVFEVIDSAFHAKLDHLIRHALLNFEPRIRSVSAQVIENDQLEGKLKIQIDFTEIITNTRHNIVYPFYHSEGTNL